MIDYKTIAALLTIWDELPVLVGAGWPACRTGSFPVSTSTSVMS